MREFMTVILFTSFLMNCEEKDKYEGVRKTLEKVFVDDQKFRDPYIPEKQNPLDQNNLKIVTKIIDSLGWLGKDEIGYQANLALFLTIQHADKLSTMEEYLLKMKEAEKNNKVDKRQIAYLTDRIELTNERKQIYGTQYSLDEKGIAFAHQLIDPKRVNERRKTMGMEPIEEYLKVVNSENKKNNK